MLLLLLADACLHRGGSAMGSGSSTEVAHSPHEFTANDSVAGSHNAADVAGEDAAVAAGVLLLGHGRPGLEQEMLSWLVAPYVQRVPQ